MSHATDEPRPIQRRFNVVLFGETGAGKSSVVNLVAGRDVARIPKGVSQYPLPFDSKAYNVTIQGQDFGLFDTADLDHPQLLTDPNYLIGAIIKAHRFVRRLSDTGGVNLLVFCMRRGGITRAQDSYLLFHDFLCQKKVPVALVVTHLEHEENMEDWWLYNNPLLKVCGIDVVDHACITTKRNFGIRYDTSRQLVHDLLIAHGCGAGFMQERLCWVMQLFKRVLNSLGFRPHQDSLRVRLRKYGLSEDDVTAFLHTISQADNEVVTRRLFSPSPIGVKLLPASTSVAAVDDIGGPTPINLDEASLDDDRAGFPNDLTSQVIRESPLPVASGGFADIHKGAIRQSTGPIKVAIKVIKTYSAEDDDFVKKRKRLRREIKVWLSLKHDNVLPLLGTTNAYGPFPAMVSPWAENGTLTSYLESQRELPVVDLLRLLINVASGLQYLNSRSVVHGDLSGSNILICEKRTAYITDFGLSTLLTELGGSTFATSFHARGTIRWMAPELLDIRVPENDLEEVPHVLPTTHSDVYSFGSVMLQILSGKVPYHYYARDVQVLHAVTKGILPTRPSCALITKSRWEFIQRCWSTVDITRTRPSNNEIVDFTESEHAAASVS